MFIFRNFLYICFFKLRRISYRHIIAPLLYFHGIFYCSHRDCENNTSRSQTTVQVMLNVHINIKVSTAYFQKKDEYAINLKNKGRIFVENDRLIIIVFSYICQRFFRLINTKILSPILNVDLIMTEKMLCISSVSTLKQSVIRIIIFLPQLYYFPGYCKFHASRNLLFLHLHKQNKCQL